MCPLCTLVLAARASPEARAWFLRVLSSEEAQLWPTALLPCLLKEARKVETWT